MFCPQVRVSDSVVLDLLIVIIIDRLLSYCSCKVKSQPGVVCSLAEIQIDFNPNIYSEYTEVVVVLILLLEHSQILCEPYILH